MLVLEWGEEGRDKIDALSDIEYVFTKQYQGKWETI